jgi:NAD(P)-dependent dehydrogenase (short-subunit alcohol dehydrogenase family)
MYPRAVLVTGANRGIGLELVKQLVALENGPVHVFAACRNPDSATVGVFISEQLICVCFQGG